jgi:hypothetical protein
MKKIYFGRHVFGLAAIWLGVVTLIWHDPKSWQQFHVLWKAPHGDVWVVLIAAIEIFGGLTIQWPQIARLGAIALGTVFLIFALLCIPGIVAQPLVYDRWGNFFEPFSQFAGALIVYAAFARGESQRGEGLARLGYIFFGICVISFALEQLFYLSATAGLVPKWIPPGQMFWAITTTIAFALAAIALLAGRCALLAAQLLTAMVIGFGILVWLPMLFADPHKAFNWSETVETFSIAGVSWIVAAGHCAHQQLELARGAGVDGPVAGIVRPWRQLIDQHTRCAVHEHFDRQQPHKVNFSG